MESFGLKTLGPPVLGLGDNWYIVAPGRLESNVASLFFEAWIATIFVA